MLEWTTIGQESMLKDGEMTEIILEKEHILLARVDGQYYAVQAFCSHMGGKFTAGHLRGYVVSCPRNESLFDVRNGEVVKWLTRLPDTMRKIATGIQHPRKLKTYPVRVERGMVLISIEDISPN